MQGDTGPYRIGISFSPFGDMTAMVETAMRESQRAFGLWIGAAVKVAEIQAGAITAMAAAAGSGAVAGATLNLPFSGDVVQRIDPDTNWGVIASPAPKLEKAITENVASYGRQIGWMMELLLDLSDKVDGADAAKVEKIRQLKARIEHLKEAAGR